MKWILLLSFSFFVCVSCKKDHNSSNSPAIPDGIWVDQARPQDTIITYREGNMNVLFDKSQTYRETRPHLTSDDFSKWIYKLEPGKIRIKNYPQQAEDYSNWDFTWTVEGQEFSFSANAIRPYLSSTGNKRVYKRV